VTNNRVGVVLLGEGERAGRSARLAEEMESLEGRSAAFDDLRACQLGTLGAALSSRASSEEAIAPLEQSIARGDAKAAGQRAFHLGEAFDALGRSAEREWERAERLAAGDRAAERPALSGPPLSRPDEPRRRRGAAARRGEQLHAVSLRARKPATRSSRRS
jgi:hypothetical protein